MRMISLLALWLVSAVLFPERWTAVVVALAASSPASDSSSSTSTLASMRTSSDHNYYEHVTAEVVGGAGRMGSLVLTTTARAVPKGIAPGGLSKPGTPIYVATPAQAWPQVLECTPQERRNDLVWFGNGIPPPITDGATTVVVPHFGVLQVNADPVTSPESPPTFLYGKHAGIVQQCLEQKGIQTELLHSFAEIKKAAAQKLLWASSMWLLCHDNSSKQQQQQPRTVVQIDNDTELDPLVRKELFPALCARLPECDFQPNDCDACIEYLKRYSQSMPQAIPKKELCRSEWKERNAFFLAVRDQVPQPKHEALLRNVGEISQQEMDDTVAQLSPSLLLQNKNSDDDDNNGNGTGSLAQDDNNQQSNHKQQKQLVEMIPSLGLSVIGKRTDASPTAAVNTAIVVGGGILGSSVALHLARQGVQVQVLDMQSSSSSSSTNNDNNNNNNNNNNALGKTTPASWAWLNANGKSPPDYAWLNQLGMDGWKRDPLLRYLPTWSGALVRFAKPQDDMILAGGYRIEGPLTEERMHALEPAANLQGEGYVYFFPDEGSVDPSMAVQTIREEAAKLGVSFQGQVNVTGFTREQHKVTGVTAHTMNDNDGEATATETTTLQADVVVLAAGVGMTGLGNIPLLHRPGQIAFAKPSGRQQSLQRILVDTVRESHVLQRKDGTYVTGGGALEVGGKGGATALQTAGKSKDSPLSDDDTLLGRARQVLPGLIGDLMRSEQAVRPIPLDGLPAVGYLDRGLYAVVSHSGITLAPILGALAATEIAKGMFIDTLEPFRPTRFKASLVDCIRSVDNRMNPK